MVLRRVLIRPIDLIIKTSKYCDGTVWRTFMIVMILQNLIKTTI